jgi:hypothetical protein
MYINVGVRESHLPTLDVADIVFFNVHIVAYGSSDISIYIIRVF